MNRSTLCSHIAGTLLVCGLAVGPPVLHAQDYIDIEAERRAQEGQGVTQPQPSQSYPESESRYGPDSESGYGAPSGQPVPPSSGAVDSGQSAGSAGELFYQLQLLQQEVMDLRGKVEEQEYQIRQLREQSLERYLDLDQRLKSGGAATAGTAPAAAGAGTPGTGPATVQELAGESDAYRAAYSLVRSQQFGDAVAAFRQFLVDFPGGKYAANAHYWLGELYLVQVPPDDESARREFNRLLEQYPENGKIPDALYKLGKIYYDRGNRDRAREYLDRVINEFGDSGSSAVKLARDFISQNY